VQRSYFCVPNVHGTVEHTPHCHESLTVQALHGRVQEAAFTWNLLNKPGFLTMPPCFVLWNVLYTAAPATEWTPMRIETETEKTR